jgi:hypothetical protein
MRIMNQLRAGSIVEPRDLLSIHSEPIPVPDQGQLVHLQFRRFAGCPVCNLHLHSVVQRHDAILAASIREVIVFHTSTEELLYHSGNLPFAVIGDPGKKLYAEFGVESGPRALLDPRAWLPILRGVFRSLMAIFRGRPLPPLNPHEDGWVFRPISSSRAMAKSWPVSTGLTHTINGPSTNYWHSHRQRALPSRCRVELKAPQTHIR